MPGWLQKFLKLRVSLSNQQNQEANVTKNSVTPVSSALSSSTSPPTIPSKPQLQSVLSSDLRWKRKYDLFVCHSSDQSDIEEATRLVLFLEGKPHSLRCFLWQRDTCPGGAVFTEFCQAVQNSHLRALLITPNFLRDDWCTYMMHQVLAEGPMSCRMIPLLQNLSHSQYPQEMKFYYYIDLSKNADLGYAQVNKTVLKYLEGLIKKEMTLNLKMNISNSGLDGEDSSKEEKLMSKCGTSTSLEVMQ